MKTLKRLIFTIIVVFGGNLAFSEDELPDLPHWEAHCNFSEKVFYVSFDSPSNDVTEDDMIIQLRTSTKTASKVSLEPDWYIPFVPPSNQESFCQQIGGYKIGADFLLLVVTHNGRPNYPHLALILIDSTSGSILDTINDIGEIPYKAQIVFSPGSFKVSVTSTWAIDKKTGGEYPEASWQEVTIKNQKLAHRRIK
jgi:hypothetical protein